MPDLQITLIGLGAVVILAVLLYNWWQERKFRLHMASSFIEPKQDALIDDFEMNTGAFEETEFLHVSKPNRELNIANSLAEPRVDSLNFNDLVFHADAHENELDDSTLDALVPAASAHELEVGFVEPSPASLLPEPSLIDVSAPDEFNDENKPNFADEPQLIKSGDISFTQTPATNTEKITQIQADVQLPSQIDTKVDLVAKLIVGQDLADVKLNFALNDLVDLVLDLDKPVQVFGLQVSGSWDKITTDSTLSKSYSNKRFSQLVCGLQLADRGGAVSRATLNRFQHAVELLGLEVGSQVEWLTNDEPLSFAQELDEFCIEVDKIIGFHLVQGESGAFHGTKLRGLAEANGFGLEAVGTFHYKDAASNLLFSIIQQNNQPFTAESLRNIVIKGVTFQMDIPRVKNCAEVFKQMVLIAKKMQQGLSADLVDDHQKPLSELQINKISQQLEIIHTVMLNYGVTPGSAVASRLFS